MPMGAGLLKPMGSGLILLKSTFNGENFMCRLSWSICSHFVATLLKCVLQPKGKKSTTNSYFRGSGHSKSSMLINLNSPLLLLVMISTMSLLICNRFYTGRANRSNITFLGGKGYPSFTP